MFDKNFFFTPLFSTCFWIRDPRSGIRDPGSEIRDPGWVKIRIRDKHPGSATLHNFFKKFTYFLFFEGTYGIHNFSKIKSQKEVTKQ
jgi:hypothetical protein